jgi:hypothetical protein
VPAGRGEIAARCARLSRGREVVVSVSLGDPEAGAGNAGRSSASTPAFGDPGPTPSARPAAAGTGGHNSAKAAVTPGGSSCLCTDNRG